MTHSESFSFFLEAVQKRVSKPANEIDAHWQRDIIEIAWMSDLDTDDAVDMINRAYDPSPYCQYCGAKRRASCKCVIADNH